MSGTRPPSLTAPATNTALIVAHGSPSAPEGPEAVLLALARSVAALAPGWRVAGATLAGPGALERVLAELEENTPLIVPLFMSDGWFVSDELPRRLGLAGAGDCAYTPPIGLTPEMRALCCDVALAEADARGLAPEATTLLIAGHGSPSDLRARAAVEAAAAEVAKTGRFRAVRTGYVDEEPHLSSAGRIDGPALCLPYFAGRAGHIDIDVPEALAEAGFAGPLLDPLGVHPRVPLILAEMLADAAERRAT